jgi:hypothetical protein
MRIGNAAPLGMTHQCDFLALFGKSYTFSAGLTQVRRGLDDQPIKAFGLTEIAGRMVI